MTRDTSGSTINATRINVDPFGKIIANLTGTSGNDTLTLTSANNVAYGGDGNDQITGSAGDDYIYGENGDDHLLGGDGNDYIRGDSGDDEIEGGSGNDQLFGGAGKDGILDGEGDDYIDGGEGDQDWVSYWSTATASPSTWKPAPPPARATTPSSTSRISLGRTATTS